MKKATVSELKNHLSKYLNYAKRGEPVVVLDRGHPIADITPRAALGAGGEERLIFLEAQGIVHRGNPKELKDLPRLPPSKPTGLLKELLEERAESR